MTSDNPGGEPHSSAHALFNSIDWVTTPDIEVGRCLLELRVVAEAESKGLAQIPNQFRQMVIAKVGAEESGVTANAGLEKAFRKAAQGEFVEAGRIVKDFMSDQVDRLQKDELAASMLQRREVLRINSEKGARAARKYSAAEVEAWRELAAQPEIAKHSKKRKAQIIAEKRQLGPEAIESIRKSI